MTSYKRIRELDIILTDVTKISKLFDSFIPDHKNPTNILKMIDNFEKNLTIFSSINDCGYIVVYVKLCKFMRYLYKYSIKNKKYIIYTLSLLNTLWIFRDKITTKINKRLKIMHNINRILYLKAKKNFDCCDEYFTYIHKTMSILIRHNIYYIDGKMTNYLIPYDDTLSDELNM